MNASLQYIIFDLDDTLYPRSSGVMQEIGRRIQQWLQQTFDLSPEEASAMRRRYFLRYGTTLAGLMAANAQDIDVDDYLFFVHDIPVETYLDPSPALDRMLWAIPLSKAVYTNATSTYARRVLRALDVIVHFEHVIGIEDVGMHSKADRRAYERALEILGVPGSACIMVEDTLQNLEQAKALGMTTILVDGQPDGHVDVAVDDLLKVGEVIEDLLNGRRPAL